MYKKTALVSGFFIGRNCFYYFFFKFYETVIGNQIQEQVPNMFAYIPFVIMLETAAPK